MNIAYEVIEVLAGVGCVLGLLVGVPILCGLIRGACGSNARASRAR
jgi:hypothetical protein